MPTHIPNISKCSTQNAFEAKRRDDAYSLMNILAKYTPQREQNVFIYQCGYKRTLYLQCFVKLFKRTTVFGVFQSVVLIFELGIRQIQCSFPKHFNPYNNSIFVSRSLMLTPN